MIDRRTLVVSGVGALALGTVAVAVGVAARRQTLDLELSALTPLVGTSFTDAETGRRLVLEEIVGPRDTAPTAKAFTLRYSADATDELTSSIRTLTTGDRELTLFLSPVGPDRTQFEAIVDRSV